MTKELLVICFIEGTENNDFWVFLIGSLKYSKRTNTDNSTSYEDEFITNLKPVGEVKVYVD